VSIREVWSRRYGVEMGMDVDGMPERPEQRVEVQLPPRPDVLAPLAPSETLPKVGCVLGRKRCEPDVGENADTLPERSSRPEEEREAVLVVRRTRVRPLERLEECRHVAAPV
jgi:hypothetical protein